MSSLDHPAVAKVAAALTEAGRHRAADGIGVLPAEVRTAAQAAQAPERYEVVWAAAGHTKSVFPVTYRRATELGS